MKIIQKISSLIRNERGLTLMEIVVTLVAVTIIIIPVSKLINVTVVGYKDIQSYNFVVESARIGMNIMMSELRSVETQTDVNGGSSTSITIDIPTSSRDITYELVSDDEMITRQEGTGFFDTPYPFIIFVKDLQFTYYDRDDNSISVPNANLWRIQIKLTVGDDVNEYALYNQVFPRQWLN
jgi:hypothetical protein